jgi:hypothetical protein
MKGQCLCGQVSWVADGEPTGVNHCHCSMCRRWTGAAFATLVWFERKDVRWTGVQAKLYRSSPIAWRSHCDNCGTPIHLDYDQRTDLAFAVGTVDNPNSVRPHHHYGIEGKLDWVDELTTLPSKVTAEKW